MPMAARAWGRQWWGVALAVEQEYMEEWVDENWRVVLMQDQCQ